MKKTLFLLAILAIFSYSAQAQDEIKIKTIEEAGGSSNPKLSQYEFRMISTIESVVAGGLGRSRLLTTNDKGQEVILDMENFFSFVGLNIGNIQSNNRSITGAIRLMYDYGWELQDIATGSYGPDKSTGIFITRYYFRRPINK